MHNLETKSKAKNQGSLVELISKSQKKESITTLSQKAEEKCKNKNRNQ